MFFIPYGLDLPPEKFPLANIVLIVLCCLFFVLTFYTPILDASVDGMILDGWRLSGIMFYSFLHAGWMHLIGNMILLWVFGNAICSKVGSMAYFLMFLGFGVISAAGHNIFDGAPAIGASGALYGVLGFFFALYPTNKISCFWWFFGRSGTLEIPAWTLFGLYVLKDLFGVFDGNSNVAHMAHLSGFFGGLVLGYWLLKAGHLAMNEWDRKTLPDLVY